MRVNVGLPFKRLKAEITWDLLNMINLFDSNAGLLEYANFNDLLVVRPTVTDATTDHVANLLEPVPPTTCARAGGTVREGRSASLTARQMQLGLSRIRVLSWRFAFGEPRNSGFGRSCKPGCDSLEPRSCSYGR